MLLQLLTDTATVPCRQSEGAAGYDIYSDENSVIFPKERRLVSTGIAITIPKSYYGRIAPRSSLSVKDYIDVGAGVIDNDYTGEIKVLLINNGNNIFTINKGDRIAQLILEKIGYCEIVVVDSLEDTERGDGGFGSTGK
jgi:dUTP pyrophosphatase